MSIVNRRNAVLGWATWKVGKQCRVKKKARQAAAARAAVEQAGDRGGRCGRARGLGALAEEAQAHRGR